MHIFGWAVQRKQWSAAPRESCMVPCKWNFLGATCVKPFRFNAKLQGCQRRISQIRSFGRILSRILLCSSMFPRLQLGLWIASLSYFLWLYPLHFVEHMHTAFSQFWPSIQSLNISFTADCDAWPWSIHARVSGAQNRGLQLLRRELECSWGINY